MVQFVTFILGQDVKNAHKKTTEEAVPCPSFWILINSLSISHSTQASIAPLLVSSSNSFLPSHLMLAASSEHEAYNLTSSGVLATPPTMICKLGWIQIRDRNVICHSDAN